uniref:NADH-ubiquinone oxidoreductase chain 1 n=1 Tax=Pomacea aulanieri TaxID=2842512 RepID=A0AA96LYU0_9CAEN|nr:NADH dehydrogenase subunit 1 [Pomacea aulanieri]WNR57055.1 NADH dehydrogenase subunit 1 [Pomacea aulanieri]
MYYPSVMSYMLTCVVILLAVAFFTLLERKELSYMQIRKGPNKVGFMGIPQPIADAMKLLIKEITSPVMANSFPYFIAPIFSFILALFMWQLYPSLSGLGYFKFGALFFLCVSSLNVYGTLLAGWSSNSKYALLGSLRAIAQTISYEVSMALVFLFPLFLVGTISFLDVMEFQVPLWLSFMLLPMALVWFATCVAETNRAPFDFAEGESELVSGFNIEYSSAGFALIFLAEYANILVMSLFSSLLFFGGNFFFCYSFDFFLTMKILFFSFVFIWVRASYPRFRYDLLMSLTWKKFLPFSLGGLLIMLSFLFLIDY